MHRDQRHLRGADEVEAVVGDRVVVALLRGEEAGAVHRLLAHEHRRQHGHEPRGGQPVEREPVEREREQRRVADDEAEARARDASRRAPCRSRRARGARAPLGRGAFAPLADDDRVLVAHPVRGRVSCGTFGTFASAASRSASAAASCSSSALQLVLDLLQLLELLGRRLAVELLARAQLVDLRHERAPALVGGEQLVEGVSPAPRRASAARTASGSLRAARRSIIASSLARLRAPAPRLVPRRARADPVGDRLHARVRVLDGDPVARPLDQLARRSRRRRTRSSARG